MIVYICVVNQSNKQTKGESMKMYELICKIEKMLEKMVGKMDYRDWWLVDKSSCEMGFDMEDGRIMIVTIMVEDVKDNTIMVGKKNEV